MLISAMGQGFLYAPMALGVFITFRILKTPDLTVDGSFVAGMTVCAAVTVAGHPLLGIAAGTLAGALAGFCTGFLQTKLGINAILAGILTMTGLYTVNYAVLGGQSNLYLQSQTVNELGVAVPTPSPTIYKMFSSLLGDTMEAGSYVLILTGIIVAVLCAVLAVFFRTRPGMAIRATGDNEEMVRSSSINADASRIAGVMMANGLVAMSGAFLCHSQRYADLNCGSGMLVMGLASVIIGQVLLGDGSVLRGVLSAAAGSVLYRIIIQIAYKIDMPSYAVKLLSAFIVVIFLTLPLIKAKLKGRGEAVRR